MSAGKADYCRPCNRTRTAEWAEAHPEKRKLQTAAYRAKHREDRNAKALARYYRKMVEDPERVRKYRREWAQTEKGMIANRSGRHRRRGAALTSVARGWVPILLRDPCSYCGAPAIELDHITPITDGGHGDWDNLTPACRTCNASKNDQTLIGHLVRNGA